MSGEVEKAINREPYATAQDVIDLGRALTADEKEKAEKLLLIISDRLRIEAKKVGRNLDDMIGKEPALASVAKGIVVDIVIRALAQPQNTTAATTLSQYSESAMGYSISGTVANPGGGMFIKKAELAALGLRQQRYGVIDFYGDD